MKRHIFGFILCNIILAALLTACEPIEGSIEEVKEKAGWGGPYTVTFMSNGGGPEPELQIKERGDKISEPPLMIFHDVTFVGWYKEANFINKWDFDKDTVSRNTTLYAKWNFILPLTYIDYVVPYLNGLAGGTSVSNPVDLPMKINLGVMTSPGSGWKNLLQALVSANKYVCLDLSQCTMSGTQFNPDNSSFIGSESSILSLTLPAVADSISGGYIAGGAFWGFYRLKEIYGNNVTFIDEYAFNGTYSLEKADFPNAEKIEYKAFCNCTALQSIRIPATVEIVWAPFQNCPSLTMFNLIGVGPLSVKEGGKALVMFDTLLMSYPSASGTITLDYITSIDQPAFAGNKSLQIANFPNVTGITQDAFGECTALREIYLPNAEIIGPFAFSYCTSLSQIDFPEATYIGVLAFYECNNLIFVSLPKAEKIEYNAFQNTGTGNLYISLGKNPPSVGIKIFNVIFDEKLVTVRVPLDATGDYGPIPAVYDILDTTTKNWGNALRGIGYDPNNPLWSSNDYYGDGTVNENVTLKIEYR